MNKNAAIILHLVFISGNILFKKEEDQALNGLLEPTLVGQPNLPVLMQEEASMAMEPIRRTTRMSFFIF
jgi:hypothetical protein